MVKNTTKKHKLELIRFTEYMISGGAFFWSGYLIFFIADKGLGLNLFWAKLLANIIGWTVYYLLNRHWVFRDRKYKKQELKVSGRYIFITLVNFGLDYIIVASLKHLGLTPYLGQFVSSGFFTVWNYLWFKYWVFTVKK